MVNWRNTRGPKLEEEDEITSVFEMVINDNIFTRLPILLFQDECTKSNQSNYRL